ncbi:Ribosomal large subunit pseudouridine synthase C [Buchnera aphidicola (Eriosoma lanigerum)]|uniref:23S rRNA pseudouridine(955/2504/2580) synthase RluC n=1 Tax=Buchnera aphidicola TaxID=9 RepID=UPI003463AD18
MSTLINSVKFLIINEKIIPQRIDNYLFTKFKKIPKSMIYRILRTGQIRVNKKRILPKYKLQNKDVIRIPPIICNNIDININKKKISNNEIHQLSKIVLFEDDHLLVINKPSGIAVHGGSGIHTGIIEKFRLSRPCNKYLELVHRIDKSTSGILIIAKKRSSLHSLHQQLREKKIKKTYTALVHGNWPVHIKIVQLPLLKKNSSLSKDKNRVYVHKLGTLSETHFKIIKNYKFNTLINAYPITGKTHQIRVHTAHTGYPIVFDNCYGLKSLDYKIKNKMNFHAKQRLLLHAKNITFTHPQTKIKMNIEASLDKSFQQCLNLLQ